MVKTDLPPGRELDAALDERVFKAEFWLEQRGEYRLAVRCEAGRTPVDGRQDKDMSRYEKCDALTALRTGFFGQGSPAYSTDWRAAGEVWEKMRERGVHVGVAPFGVDGKWEAFEKMDHRNAAGEWVSSSGRECVRCIGDTGPHAIALAALAACEQSLDHRDMARHANDILDEEGS